MDTESGYEADGYRVSIQSMKRKGDELLIAYRVQFTQPEKWVVDANPIPVDVVFWDRRGEKMKTKAAAKVWFEKGFENGSKTFNDAVLKVVLPKEAGYVSVEQGSYVTKRVPLP